MTKRVAKLLVGDGYGLRVEHGDVEGNRQSSVYGALRELAGDNAVRAAAGSMLVPLVWRRVPTPRSFPRRTGENVPLTVARVHSVELNDNGLPVLRPYPAGVDCMPWFRIGSRKESGEGESIDEDADESE